MGVYGSCVQTFLLEGRGGDDDCVLTLPRIGLRVGFVVCGDHAIVCVVGASITFSRFAYVQQGSHRSTGEARGPCGRCIGSGDHSRTSGGDRWSTSEVNVRMFVGSELALSVNGFCSTSGRPLTLCENVLL